MISVAEAPKVNREPSDSIEVETLGAEDIAKLHYLDAEMETVASQLQGDMFTATFNVERFPERVLSGLKMLWESGGWIVGVLQAGVNAMQMVFVKPRTTEFTPIAPTSPTPRPMDAVDARPVADGVRVSRAPKMTTPLLLRMPTRGRPSQAIEVLSEYRRRAVTYPKIEVVVDEDDASMRSAVVLQRLYDLDCTVTFGRHKNKIDAVNGGRVDDWGILTLISDDMVPVIDGYDKRIIEEMDRHFPLRDGCIYFDDGYNKGHSRPGSPVLCTLPIMGRHLWDQFGYVYEPCYGSLFSDEEQTLVLTKMRRIAFVDEMIIEHRHYAAGKAPHDALYKYNDETYSGNDRITFEQRRARGFDMPQMTLSILVCTVPERADNLRRLEEHLRMQMRRHPRRVELCVDAREGGRAGVTVGEKRQALLERAVGDYVAFVDDDDMVAYDYVDRVLEAVAEAPDCLSLVGVMTVNGSRPERFEHSLKYNEWRTVSREGAVLHERYPNHLNVVRRDLALQVGFVSKDVGEDHDFSTRLRPLLKTEKSTGSEPLYYYFYRPQQSVQARGAK